MSRKNYMATNTERLRMNIYLFKSKLACCYPDKDMYSVQSDVHLYPKITVMNIILLSHQVSKCIFLKLL